MTPKQRLEMITKALDNGKTVYIQSALKAWKVTPNTSKAFKDAGQTLFKASEKSLYMARGRSFDCITFCGITIR